MFAPDREIAGKLSLLHPRIDSDVLDGPSPPT